MTGSPVFRLFAELDPRQPGRSHSYSTVGVDDSIALGRGEDANLRYMVAEVDVALAEMELDAHANGQTLVMPPRVIIDMGRRPWWLMAVALADQRGWPWGMAEKVPL